MVDRLTPGLPAPDPMIAWVSGGGAASQARVCRSLIALRAMVDLRPIQPRTLRSLPFEIWRVELSIWQVGTARPTPVAGFDPLADGDEAALSPTQFSAPVQYNDPRFSAPAASTSAESRLSPVSALYLFRVT